VRQWAILGQFWDNFPESLANIRFLPGVFGNGSVKNAVLDCFESENPETEAVYGGSGSVLVRLSSGKPATRKK